LVTSETLIEALGRAQFAYDKGGEEHYNLASALIKSLRNSDVNAALYWLARMIAGGEDAGFIARRLVISRRTAEHHVQDVYAHIGVSSRAGAALFAMEHDLLKDG